MSFCSSTDPREQTSCYQEWCKRITLTPLLLTRGWQSCRILTACNLKKPAQCVHAASDCCPSRSNCGCVKTESCSIDLRASLSKFQPALSWTEAAHPLYHACLSADSPRGQPGNLFPAVKEDYGRYLPVPHPVRYLHQPARCYQDGLSIAANKLSSCRHVVYATLWHRSSLALVHNHFCTISSG